MKNYTILYKCDKCGKLSQKLQLYCFYCGIKLVNKGEMKDENRKQRKKNKFLLR
jgi:DNA-directed RNA polymerase subunit RPC12/RpoP